ncbi:MAG: hypothetical protein LBJ63_06545 [Prevotellaceae bacterium]|jgi:hypothetical protein|nr:hypothetical protein [Prevotellaceae bacterium]
MNEMELEVQIQKLQEMRSYLGDFCVEMNQQIDDLQTDLHGYKAHGFPREIADKYESFYYAPARNDIQEMITRINTYHYQYIDAVIEDLMRALQR